jgi:hypothetical protein
MDDKLSQPKQPAWTGQLREHFGSVKLGEAQASSLEALLLSTPISVPTAHTSPVSAAAPPVAPASGAPASWWRSIHASGAGYVVSALLAASAVFVVDHQFSESGLWMEEPDLIADLANQPGPRAYPADFDLEGDPAGFREIVKDVFPQQDLFSADLPKQLAGGVYFPSEGRFFSWSGQPGVSIVLKGAQGVETSPATLYIVRLTDKNEQKFPQVRTVKRIAAKSGKVRKANVWREGRYGYAVVQSLAVNE